MKEELKLLVFVCAGIVALCGVGYAVYRLDNAMEQQVIEQIKEQSRRTSDGPKVVARPVTTSTPCALEANPGSDLMNPLNPWSPVNPVGFTNPTSPNNPASPLSPMNPNNIGRP